jgi:quinohemoprotein ethanol dehydrogenase
LGDRQYVSVLAGFGGTGSALASRWDARTQQRRLLTFSLGGDRRLPPAISSTGVVPVPDSTFRSSREAETEGGTAFLNRCATCHGFGAVAGGTAPDLRSSPAILSREAFAQIVKDGGLVQGGMPRFEELSNTELETIRQYLRSRAADLRSQSANAAPH